MGALNTFFNWRTSVNTSAMRQQAQPQMSPERKAEFNHETRWPMRWLVFAVVFCLPSFAVAGTTAMWWVLPVGVIMAVAFCVSTVNAGEMTPEDHRRASVTRQVKARAQWDNARGCTWCGSPSQHRDENGRPQHPLGFHRADIDAAVEQQMAAQPE